MFKAARVLGAELRGLLQWIVTYLPNTYFGNRIRRQYWRFRLKNANVQSVGFGATIHGCDLLELGANFVLRDHGVIEIGDSDPVYLGSNVGLGNGSYLRSANHSFDDLSTPTQAQGHTAKRIAYKGRNYSIVIEDNVWFGARCIILSGAHIGEGTIVSAGSVVSSTVPSFSIVVGNPARVIANRKKMAALDRPQETRA
jgi:acetyltransferase-like isoleucine patch superfamily enzyme